MMNRLNAINDNLTTLVSDIKALHTDLITHANAQKQSLLAIIADLADTHANLRALGCMTGTAGAALLDLSEVSGDIAEKIDDTLYQFDEIPVGSYETFVGFCEQCGKELHSTDVYEDVDAFDVLCAECAYPDTKANDAIVVTNGEIEDKDTQLVFEFPDEIGDVVAEEDITND